MKLGPHLTQKGTALHPHGRRQHLLDGTEIQRHPAVQSLRFLFGLYRICVTLTEVGGLDEGGSALGMHAGPGALVT